MEYKDPPNFRLNEPECVAVVGGRKMDPATVRAWMRDHLDRDRHVIVTGDARGADQAAADFARVHGFVLVVVPAEHLWPHYNRAAGMVRNPIVARLATKFVVAFPDAESRGTHDTIAYAKSIGRTVVLPLGSGQGNIFDHGVLG